MWIRNIQECQAAPFWFIKDARVGYATLLCRHAGMTSAASVAFGRSAAPPHLAAPSCRSGGPVPRADLQGACGSLHHDPLGPSRCSGGRDIIFFRSARAKRERGGIPLHIAIRTVGRAHPSRGPVGHVGYAFFALERGFAGRRRRHRRVADGQTCQLPWASTSGTAATQCSKCRA